MFFVLKFQIIFLKVEWVHWPQKSGLFIFIPTATDSRFLVTKMHNIQSKNMTKLHALGHKVLKWQYSFIQVNKLQFVFRERNISLSNRSSPLFRLFFGLQRCTVPRSEQDNGTGLALCLALLGCQGFCGIALNGSTSSHSKSSNIRQGLKCQHIVSIPTKTITKSKPYAYADL